MNHIILTFTILYLAVAAGCSRQDNGESGIDLTKYQAERDRLCQAFDPSTVTRCDRSTFHVLMAAMCKFSLPTEYEVPSGKWNRDTARCYPDESRSETSQDGYLSVVLAQDPSAIARVIAFAEPRRWETGEPAGGVGNITSLVPLLRGYSLANESDGVVDEGLEAAEKAFTGHRGHLVAGYVWAVARLRGGLTVAGATLLRKLHNETPESPYLSCLYHRFSRLDNDQRDTIRLLNKMPKSVNAFGWGSSPWQIHYTLTVECLEGDK